jgi:uncharacterized protein YecT (DUF1311 family)
MILHALLLLAAPVASDDCENAVAQQDLNDCAGRGAEAADAEMNLQWKRTLAYMRQRDKDDDENWASGPSYSQALLTAQRAWLAYRDAHCTSESYSTRGGSMRPMLYAMCVADLTNERTRQLAELASRDHE